VSLSLCAIALNEERFLAGMFESVLGVVDELVIGIDSRTTDRTREIAQQHGARIISFDWHDSFADARNMVVERAWGDWILALDADERLLPAGYQAIAEVLAPDVSSSIDGFRLLVDEDGVQEWTAPRLFQNEPALRYVGRVHEEVRYLPDPPRTFSLKLDDGPHLLHLGRGHPKRDRCLLHLRLRENPNDAVAYCYLALMAHGEGRDIAARTFARRALDCGPRTLHDDRVVLMQQLARRNCAGNCGH